LAAVFEPSNLPFGNLDYIAGWFKRGGEYLLRNVTSALAFVSTSSLFQGEQAELIFRVFTKYGMKIDWCHTEFKWSNQAANNAGVACCIVGVSKAPRPQRRIYDDSSVRLASNIGPYLVSMPDLVVSKRNKPLADISPMSYGSMSNDNNHF